MKNCSPLPRPRLTRVNWEFIKECTEKGAKSKSKAPKEENDLDIDVGEVDSSVIMP
jgi:hypothetical protein